MPAVDSIPAWLPVSPYQAAEIAAASPNTTSPLDHSATSPFADCDRLADTLLAEIAAGTQCLAAIAAQHHISYPRFTLWLLQPSTQERLTALSTALSTAIASAARLTATAALPDIVRGLKTTVDQLQSQTHMTIASAGGPGANHLLAESVILRRHRAVISAASLIYRISRFTCPGQHPPRPPQPEPPPRNRTHPPTARDNSAPPGRNLARLPSLPSLDLPAIDFPDLASEAGTPQPSRNPDPETRTPISSFPTSDFPHPTSDISVDDALQMLAAEYDLTAEEVAELRSDSHSWIRDFIPPSAAAKSATLSAHPTADDG